jgi:hypothetical protein
MRAMPRFRISTVLILTAIIAVLLLGALRPVSFSYRSFGAVHRVSRPPTTKEVSERMAVTLPAALLVWITGNWWIQKRRQSR